MTKSFVFAALLAGCAPSKAPPSSPSTRASPPGPGSPSLRTVYNTGYADPGGRTRQVTQGVDPAPYDGAVVVAPVRPESPAPATTSSSPKGPAPSPPSDDRIELVDRASRALCDRESACGRVGEKKTFGSAEACMAAKRERVRAQVDDVTCGEIPGARVAACLTAIRQAPCGANDKRVEPPRECQKAVLCNAP